MSIPTMLTYIKKEPAALAQLLAAYPAPFDAALQDAPKNARRWLILGTGSSINAAKSAKLYMQQIAGVHIQIEEPYNYANYETVDTATDLVFGVSQSGQSTATIAALKKVEASHNVFSIAVTSRPGTELPQAATATLDIQCGKERVGYVTMGFNNSVLALMLAALRYARQTGRIDAAKEQAELADFKAVIEKIQPAIAASEAFYQAHRKDLAHPVQYTAIGYGAADGTVSEMATKFTEVIREPAGGHDLEAFMHGPYLGIHAGDVQFYIETNASRAVRDKAAALKAYEARYIKRIYTIDLTGAAKADATLALGAIADAFKAPLAAVIPFQIFAWEITTENGVNLGDLIFTDFSTAVHNKTAVQDYV